MKLSIGLRLRSAINATYSFLQRNRLRNKKFAIISNNCWGGDIYAVANKEYNTPFVGLFIHAPCYIDLLKEFPSSLSQTLTFTSKSKYSINKPNYPIGVLGKKIEIHFLHYACEAEAKAKWERRTQRLLTAIQDINFELFFKMDDRDACTKDLIPVFHQLPFKNKAFFSCNKSQYNIIQYNSRDNMVILSGTTKVFDAINWINTGTIKNTLTNKMISKLWPLKKMWE